MDSCLETFSQIILCFKYADNEPLGIRLQGETVDISEQLYYQIYCNIDIFGILAQEAFVE